jgi:hypothetical protein
MMHLQCKEMAVEAHRRSGAMVRQWKWVGEMAFDGSEGLSVVSGDSEEIL